jgi:hypothetical protein
MTSKCFFRGRRRLACPAFGPHADHVDALGLFQLWGQRRCLIFPEATNYEMYAFYDGSTDLVDLVTYSRKDEK